MTAPEYRHDIDGLRGVAVLSVFAVHSIPQAVHGGFIGVDVFFVISGYLISLLALQAIEAGRFGLADFYLRRLRRIVPALLVVLLACLLFAVLLALPRETRAIGKHVAGGAAFVSNLVLWTEAGYFDGSSQRKPLLHLWSLGIEEQFYLLWPLAALALLRLRRQAWLAIAALLAASFVLNLAFVASKPKGVFFLPPTRFWEILVGVLLAYLNHWFNGGPVAMLQRQLKLAPRGAQRLAGAVSIGGVLLLVTAVLLIDKNDHFPGAWALLPTLGTACIIAAGSRAWPNRVLLQHPWLQFYGRISFSLYLWHWPLLTFPLLLGRPLSWWQQAAVLCASVLLATLSYRFVETPARKGGHPLFSLPCLAGALLATALAGVLLQRSDGLLQRYPPELQDIARMQTGDDYAAYRVDHCFMRAARPLETFGPACRGGEPPGQPLVALWGDSHAAALYPGLRAWAAQQPGGVRIAQFTAALCPPLPSPADRLSPGCAEANDQISAELARLGPSTVVLGGYWSRYRQAGDPDDAVLHGLRGAIARLQAAGVTDITVVGPLPEWQAPLPSLLLTAWRDDGQAPQRLLQGLVAHAVDIDARLRGIAEGAGARYFSPLRALCDSGGCLTLVPGAAGARVLAFDETHLTVAGSERLVQDLMFGR